MGYEIKKQLIPTEFLWKRSKQTFTSTKWNLNVSYV